MAEDIADLPARSRGRPSGTESAVSREQIMLAALEAFARDGFEAMSLRALSRTLGVSHSLIHHYFESKQVLWEAGVDHVYGAVRAAALELAESFDDADDPVEVVRKCIRETIIITAHHPACVRIAIDEGGRGGPRLDFLLENYFRPIDERWHSAISSFGEDAAGLLPINRRALFFLCAFGASAPFYANRLAGVFADDSLTNAQEVSRHADSVADMIIDGLRVRGG